MLHDHSRFVIDEPTLVGPKTLWTPRSVLTPMPMASCEINSPIASGPMGVQSLKSAPLRACMKMKRTSCPIPWM